MLFRLDGSVADALESAAVTASQIEALNYVVNGASEGSHRVSGKRSVLSRLASVERLWPRTRETLKRAADRYSQDGDLLNRLGVIGDVVAPGGNAPTSRLSGDQRIITFPLGWFDATSKIQPTILLGENLSDVGVFAKIGEVGTVLAKLSYLPVVFEERQGGGSSTGAVLSAIAASQTRICICIVDSDRGCPSGQLGGTAQAVGSYKDPNQYPLLAVLETAGRDLENALPDGFFQGRYGSDAHFGPIARMLGALTEIGELEARSFLDIAEGLVLRDVIDLLPSSQEGAFWRAKLNVVVLASGTNSAQMPCLANWACAAPATGKCTCLIIAGNRRDILRDFLDWHRNSSRFDLSKQLSHSVRDEWYRLGFVIASWCCGDVRQRF